MARAPRKVLEGVSLALSHLGLAHVVRPAVEIVTCAGAAYGRVSPRSCALLAWLPGGH